MVLMATPATPPRGGPPSRSAAPLEREPALRDRVREVRQLLQSVWVAADVPKLRDEVIDKLVGAIHEANEIARQASAEPGKGGGPAPKARWYQVMGYLVQVLDGVCRNVELSEINARLLKVEKALSVAKAGSSQTRRKG